MGREITEKALRANQPFAVFGTDLCFSAGDRMWGKEPSLIICLQYMDLFYSQTMISFLLFPHHRIFIKSALHTTTNGKRGDRSSRISTTGSLSVVQMRYCVQHNTHRLYYEYLHFIPACLQKHTYTALFHHSSILLILWIWFNLRGSVMYGTFFAFAAAVFLFLPLLFTCSLWFSFVATTDSSPHIRSVTFFLFPHNSWLDRYSINPQCC